MKKLSPLSALFLIACGTSLVACGSSTSSQPSDTSTATSNTADVGSASEAIKQLGKNDADVVDRCEQLVQACEKLAGDSGVGAAVCDKIGTHCAELAQQLGEARQQFEQCLQGVAACEASAANPADCKAQRAACNPAGKDFDARRGETLACSDRTQSCIPHMREMRGPGARGDDNADAGANSCGADAEDFVGCCHGHGGGEHGGGDDAGAERPDFGHGAGGFGGGLPAPRMSPGAAGDPRDGQKDTANDANDTAAGGSAGKNR